jgi:uncharacterized protein
MHNAISEIEEFLAHERLALVGASHDPKHFSRAVMRAFSAKGYEVMPVNRRHADIGGRRAYFDLQSLPGRVSAALVMVPPTDSAAVVRDAIAAGVSHLWFHKGAGQSSSNPEALRLAVEHGLTVIDGECPLMFLEPRGVHAAHAAVSRLSGAYPAGGARPVPLWNTVALAIIQVLIAVNAVIGGALMLADPSGADLGMNTGFLGGSPFSTFLVPGLVLFVVIGIGHLTAFSLTLRKDRRAPLLAVLLGVLLVVWILAQLVWLDPKSWLQVAVAALGLAELSLGLSGPRRLPRAVRHA